jgi:3',5'-cyclic AMP phosphodiesterase CpdA
VRRAPLCAVFWLLLTAPPRHGGDPAPFRVVAAGDIACDPASRYFAGSSPAWCRDRETAALAAAQRPDAILVLGDSQYERGELAAYRVAFARGWGRLRPLLRPVPGNHEYRTPGAAGYFAYFGTAAGAPGRSWYSFAVGDWHLVALDSNCREVGGCGPGSPQHRWLLADLAAHPAGCTLAFWHHPLASSGLHGGRAEVAPLWEAVDRAGVDLVLSGHDHVYERFAPQDAGGRGGGGPRQLVVGTGGKSLTGFRRTPRPHSAARVVAFGVLALDLWPDRYRWRFLGLDGKVLDTGEARCRGRAPGVAAMAE